MCVCARILTRVLVCLEGGGGGGERAPVCERVLLVRRVREPSAPLCLFTHMRAFAGLCYTNPGQFFCQENPSSPDCKKIGKWEPVEGIAFRGDFPRTGRGVTEQDTFSCVCAKKCSYWESKGALRCAEGWEILG